MDMKLNVVRFRSADVIATSGAAPGGLTPEFCDMYGTRHYIFTSLMNADTHTYQGDSYNYTEAGGLVRVSGTVFRDVANEGIELGKVYYRYVDDGGYTHAVLCEIQNHGH